MKYIVVCFISVFPTIWFGEDPVTERTYEGCKTAAISKAESIAPRFGPDVSITCGCTNSEDAIRKGYISRGELKRSTPGSI